MTQAAVPQVNVYVNHGQQFEPRMTAVTLGKDRNWFVVLLLCVVTFGIYPFFYMYSVFEEAKRFTMARNSPVAVTSGGAVIGFMFIPLFQAIWALMLLFKYPALVTKLNIATGKNSTGWGWLGLLSVFLPIVGGAAVIIIVQMQLNQIWREQRALLADEMASRHSPQAGAAPMAPGPTATAQPAHAAQPQHIIQPTPIGYAQPAAAQPGPMNVGTPKSITQPSERASQTWLKIALPAAGVAAGAIAVAGFLLIRERNHDLASSGAVVADQSDYSMQAVASPNLRTPGAAVTRSVAMTQASKIVTPGPLVAIQPIRTSAASFINNSGGKPGGAEQAVDGDPKTAWQSSTKNPVGQWLEFEFPAGTTLEQARIKTGYDAVSAKHGDLFVLNSHARTIAVIVDGQEIASKSVAEGDRDVELILQRPVKTLRLRFDAIFAGSKWPNDICVSEATFQRRAVATL